MKRISRYLAGITVLALGALAVCAQDGGLPPTAFQPTAKATHTVTTAQIGAQVNWAGGQLEAVGIGFATDGSALAQMQAKVTATTLMTLEAKKLLPDVAYDNTRKLSAVQETPEQQQAMQQLLRNITIIDEIWNPQTRAYIVIGAIPLFGTQGIVTLTTGLTGATEPLTYTQHDLVIVRPLTRGATPQPFYKKDEAYTGIIIDADFALLKPTLVTRLVRYDGKEFWTPAELTPFASLTGAVRYATTLQTAIDGKLAGDRPLIVTAVGTAQGSYPIFNLDDTYILQEQHKFSGLLKQLPLIITLGDKAE